MAVLEYVVFGSICALLAVFVNFPAPKLSTRLQAWKRTGSFMMWKDLNIFYIDEKGTGPSRTLVCLHGFPTCSYDWIKVLPKLREQFSRIILLDFLGFGFSDKPTAHVYTIGEQADIVEELTQSLGITQPHDVSHDYGDTVALELLARHNSKKSKLCIQSLSMLNGGIFPDTHYPRKGQKLLLMPVLGYLASRLISHQIFCKGLAEVFGAHKPTKEDDEDFWAALRYNDGDKATVGVINFLRERQSFKQRWVGALENSQVKVLMIYGPADPVNPPQFAEHFKERLPAHKLVTLHPSVGHYPQWEDPSTVTEALTLFINSLVEH